MKASKKRIFTVVIIAILLVVAIIGIGFYRYFKFESNLNFMISERHYSQAITQLDTVSPKFYRQIYLNKNRDVIYSATPSFFENKTDYTALTDQNKQEATDLLSLISSVPEKQIEFFTKQQQALNDFVALVDKYHTNDMRDKIPFIEFSANNEIANILDSSLDTTIQYTYNKYEIASKLRGMKSTWDLHLEQYIKTYNDPQTIAMNNVIDKLEQYSRQLESIADSYQYYDGTLDTEYLMETIDELAAIGLEGIGYVQDIQQELTRIKSTII